MPMASHYVVCYKKYELLLQTSSLFNSNIIFISTIGHAECLCIIFVVFAATAAQLTSRHSQAARFRSCSRCRNQGTGASSFGKPAGGARSRTLVSTFTGISRNQSSSTEKHVKFNDKISNLAEQKKTKTNHPECLSKTTNYPMNSFSNPMLTAPQKSPHPQTPTSVSPPLPITWHLISPRWYPRSVFCSRPSG
jgi:hypothetical protein